MVALQGEVRKEMEDKSSPPSWERKTGADFKDLHDHCLPILILMLNAASIALGSINFDGLAFLIVSPPSLLALLLFALFDDGVPRKKHLARMLKRGKIRQILAGILVTLMVPSIIINIGMSLTLIITRLFSLFN
jgi:hypothetical protein